MSVGANSAKIRVADSIAAATVEEGQGEEGREEEIGERGTEGGVKWRGPDLRGGAEAAELG